MRSKKVYWLLWMILFAIESVRFPYIGGTTAEGIIWAVIQMVAFPLLLARDKLWYRALVIIATAVTSILVEMLALLLATVLGIDATNSRQVVSHPLEYWLCQVFVLFLFVLSFGFLYALLCHISASRGTVALKQFGVGLLGQLGVTFCMTAVAEYGLESDQTVLITGCIFAFVNIVADALILISLLRASALYYQHERMALLRSHLDATFFAFKGLADEVQAVARFRHDLRAELQAVAGLVRAGEYARAGMLVGELERRIALPDGGGAR